MSGIYIPNMKMPIGHNEATFGIDADGHPLLAIYTEKNTEPEIYYIIPAADVRPVVLCRDCLHYEMGACLKIYDDGAANKDAWQERKPDNFCSYGEDRNVPTNCGADMSQEVERRLE